MKYDALENHLLSKKGSFLDFPFGDDTAVFKVVAKMFALVAWCDDPLLITLKCAPDEADFFRSLFEAVKPGYYMNKDHWNTITLDGSVPQDMLLDMIESSYNLVVKGLRKSDRQKLESQTDKNNT